MQVAILSGKGGAGKTLLAVNLTNLMNGSVFLDCDVEEPNGVFYFSDHFVQEPIYNLVPKVNDDLYLNISTFSKLVLSKLAKVPTQF